MAQRDREHAIGPEVPVVGRFERPVALRGQVGIAGGNARRIERSVRREVREVELAHFALDAQAQLVERIGSPGRDESRLGKDERLRQRDVARGRDGRCFDSYAALERKRIKRAP